MKRKEIEKNKQKAKSEKSPVVPLHIYKIYIIVGL